MKGRQGSGRLPKGIRGSSASLASLAAPGSSQKFFVLWILLGLWLVYLLCTTGASRRGGVSLGRQTNSSLSVATALTAQIGELNLGQYGPDMVRLAFRKAVSPVEAATHSRGVRREDTAEFLDLFTKLQALVSKISTATPPDVACSWDTTLHTSSHLGSDGSQKYLIAADMHNNEELLPHFTNQLLHFLALMPTGSVFLSLYESGSTDSTGAWLEVLRNLVTAMQIPHRIVIGGTLTRAQQQDRIDFLASARNRALEPLWLNTSFPGEGGLPAQGGFVEPETLGWTLYDTGRGRARPLWPADRVIFLNDVYFCARDVVRLLQHDADMVCGLDFDRPRLQDAPLSVQQRLFAEDMRQRFWLPLQLGSLLSRWDSVRDPWKREGSRADDIYQVASPLEFYDIWVARDLDGQQFLKGSPYVTDPYSLQRIRAGLPFRVKCCWNGLVVMRAAPFVQQNLRMRMHRQGECAASECTLLCNDLLRLGHTRFLVDPGVRQAYRPRDVKVLYDPNFVQGIAVTDWADVAHSRPIDWSLAPLRPYYQCCGLKPGWDMVEWDKDCQWDNFMTPNYTAMPAAPGVTEAPYVSANISYVPQRPEIHFLKARRNKLLSR